MFGVTNADAAAIRTAFEQRGEFAAAIEVRRRFPGITDNAQAGERARTIAGWRPRRPVKMYKLETMAVPCDGGSWLPNAIS